MINLLSNIFYQLRLPGTGRTQRMMIYMASYFLLSPVSIDTPFFPFWQLGSNILLIFSDYLTFFNRHV